jgi:hypothetical protein
MFKAEKRVWQSRPGWLFCPCWKIESIRLHSHIRLHEPGDIQYHAIPLLLFCHASFKKHMAQASAFEQMPFDGRQSFDRGCETSRDCKLPSQAPPAR